MRSGSREQIAIVRPAGRPASSRARNSLAPGWRIASSAFSNTKAEGGPWTRQAASATSSRSAAEPCPSPMMVSVCERLRLRSGFSSASAGSSRRASSTSEPTPRQSQIPRAG